MSSSAKSSLNRRQFILAAGSIAALNTFRQRSPSRGVSLVIDPADPVAGTGPAQWAAREFEQSLVVKGIAVQRCAQLSQAKPGDCCVIAAGAKTPLAAGILKTTRVSIPAAPEALGLIPARIR